MSSDTTLLVRNPLRAEPVRRLHMTMPARIFRVQVRRHTVGALPVKLRRRPVPAGRSHYCGGRCRSC